MTEILAIDKIKTLIPRELVDELKIIAADGGSHIVLADQIMDARYERLKKDKNSSQNVEVTDVMAALDGYFPQGLDSRKALPKTIERSRMYQSNRGVIESLVSNFYPEIYNSGNQKSNSGISFVETIRSF